MKQRLDDVTTGQRPAGLYRLPADVTPEAVERWAAEHGWRFFHVDGSAVSDKRSFIRAVGSTLEFPSYSGQNWDAFEESIRDMAWAPAPGYIVLFDEPDQFAARDPDQWQRARSVLEGAVAFWREKGVPMVVLLRKAGRALPDIPWL